MVSKRKTQNADYDYPKWGGGGSEIVWLMLSAWLKVSQIQGLVHLFTQHQTVTKSLFSANCWHSNTRIMNSDMIGMLILLGPSQSHM